MPRGCLLPPGSLALRVLPSLISKPPKSTEYLQALPFSPQKSRSCSCRFLSKPQNKYHLVSIRLFTACWQVGQSKGPECPWGGLARDVGQLCPDQLRWARHGQHWLHRVASDFRGLHNKFSTVSPFGDVLGNIKKIISG